MQREIKFRAWDTEKRCYVPEGEIIFSFYGDTKITVTPNAIEYIGDKCHYSEPNPSRFIVEQFTGLTDKNGTEIYEFDVIAISGNDNLKKVEFKNGCFYTTSVNNNSMYRLGGWEKDSVTVLGNIHTNPELIK